MDLKHQAAAGAMTPPISTDGQRRRLELLRERTQERRALRWRVACPACGAPVGAPCRALTRLGPSWSGLDHAARGRARAEAQELARGFGEALELTRRATGAP